MIYTFNLFLTKPLSANGKSLPWTAHSHFRSYIFFKIFTINVFGHNFSSFKFMTMAS